QIPAWHAPDGRIFVARSAEDAERQARAAGVEGPLVRDPDVLDTWFSSALVPFTDLGWRDQTPDLDWCLPSGVLITCFDIIVYWLAHMFMMRSLPSGKVLMREIYALVLVCDMEIKQMPKTTRNTIGPVHLIDGSDLAPPLAKRTSGL